MKCIFCQQNLIENYNEFNQNEVNNSTRERQDKLKLLYFVYVRVCKCVI